MRAGQGGRVRRAVYAVTAVSAMVFGLAACAGETVAGKASAMDGIDTDDAGGMAVNNDGPSGPREGVPDAELAVENSDGGEYDRLAINAVADLYTYWHEQMPALFDQEFTELEQLLSYDNTTDDIDVCGTSILGLKNAFYCGGGGFDVIAWDRGELLPELVEQFGEMSVVAVLAHEMGHAVQFRLGEKSNVDQSTPTIVTEQQADCYMGNFFRYVADDKSEHFQINTGDGLNQILATLFSIRDPAGFAADDIDAHGLAFDRVYAFQEGFRNDPTRCAEMDVPEIEERIAEKARTADEEQGSQEGEVDVTDQQIQQLLDESLNRAFSGNENFEPPQIRYEGAECADGHATPPVTYCADDHTIAADLTALEQIATPPTNPEDVGAEGTAGIGDFAAFAEVASRYALAVQQSAGGPLDDEQAGLRTACLTGAWAGVADQDEQGDAELALRLAVGDLDEAVAELLQDDSLIAADVNGTQVPSGFARVEAFRIGYFDGWETCLEFA